MSDTSETDSEEVDISGAGITVLTKYVRADFARRLERERDELRSKFTKLDKPRYSGLPMLDDLLKERNPEFDAWVANLPASYWLRYDLSAARIGWESAMELAKNRTDE